MKHIVLGQGNLGIDLAEALRKKGHDVSILDRGSGFNYPCNIYQWDWKCDFIWNCIGYGSVEVGQTKLDKQIQVLLGLPLELSSVPERGHLINFSSNYAQEPQLSNYATVKKMLEEISNFRNDVTCIRVESLYGNHKPCFPTKIRDFSSGSFPKNEVTPTPTWWLADMLSSDEALKSINPFRTEILKPMGSTTTREWAELIIGKRLDHRGFDNVRPIKSENDSEDSFCFVTEHWRDLWDNKRNELK